MLLTESSVYRPAPRLSSGKWHAGVRHRHRCPRCGRLGVDANHELPVAFAVTPASYGEQPVAQLLLDQLQGRHPDLLQQCQLVHGQENVIYSYDGQVSCMCPRTGAQRAMDYGGFERDRNTLKYRCPARYSGVTCEGREQCPVADAVHIKLAEGTRSCCYRSWPAGRSGGLVEQDHAALVASLEQVGVGLVDLVEAVVGRDQLVEQQLAGTVERKQARKLPVRVGGAEE